MAGVTELGYLGINVSDGDAWRKFGTEVVGLELLDEGEGDRFYFRMDSWHHRFVVHVNDKDDMAYAGWRVADAEALAEILARLDGAGFAYRMGTMEEAAERRVLGLAKLTDPSGNPLELFYGPLIDAHMPFHPGRRMHGKFVTGAEGLGHMLIHADDPVESHRFYSLLGMKGAVQYHLRSPKGTVQPVFMHCNDRQHSLAFGVNGDKRLNHLMLEYAELNDLGKAHDIVRSQGIDVALQLGKHSNDEALTFYFVTPSGWLLELGWGAAKAFLQQQYHLNDVFGHGIEVSGMHDVEL
ncbi:MAG: VOC family protein [Rhizorhabdus sp.]|uniref:VOC family protein n=1 Tax=Rhizorhabdus sp. TaxID=1968843 RepID=UPI001B536B5A|nr:VOC family protein [Rhizorhabdus sp.]MBP8235200.1 VOC family protein [Rhizorhabdus sp.]